MLSRPIVVFALVAAAFAGGMVWRERVANSKLLEAKAEIASAERVAAQLRSSLATTLIADSLFRRRTDSINAHVLASRQQWLRTRNAIPPVPAVAPDTCRPWLDRAEGLQAALTDAEIHIDDLTALVAQDSLTIGNLRGAVVKAEQATGELQKRLARASDLIPTTTLAPPRLLLIGDLRAQPDHPLELTLAVGSRVLPSVDLYGGVVQDLSTGARRLLVGARSTIRLR